MAFDDTSALGSATLASSGDSAYFLRMAKATHMTGKADQLAFCRQCRDEAAAALERYRAGEDKCFVNDVDITARHMDSLRRIIHDLDDKIKTLTADG